MGIPLSKMAARNVMTSSSNESPEKGQLSTEVSVCNICLKQFARYTCPRCGLKYCSLSCYRSEKHLRCSEEFYKEEVVDSLKQQTGSEEDRKKVMRILQRLQEQEVAGEVGRDGLEDEAVEEEELSLQERFEGLDIQSLSLDSAAIWERLSERERSEFQSLLSDGHLGGLLEEYTPWWRVPVPKITEEDSTIARKLPSLVKDVPSLHSLLHGKAPSPAIKYNVLNVLFAYVYVVRLYNGSHLELCSQASQNLLDISGVLSGCVQSFNTCQEGLTHAITTVQQNHDLWNSSAFSQSVLEDIVLLLQDTSCHFLLHALSDMHHLLERGRREGKRYSPAPSEASKKLWLAKKKVLFLISWCTELTSSVRELAPVVQVEIENTKFLEAQFVKEKEGAERTRTTQRPIHTKPLIEELT